MNYSPLGAYDDNPQETLGDKLSKPDALFDLILSMSEDEDSESFYDLDLPTSSEPSTQTRQTSSSEKPPSVQARFLSDLVDQIVADGKLLLTEDGQAFGYQEDGGYYKPINNLEAFVANVLPPDVTRNLLSRNLREIGERLSWETAIRCDPHVVNLENGVFSMATSELIEHSPSFRFTYQVHAQYLEDEGFCPEFERFCQTPLDGDLAKRQLLLEFIGYICADTNNGKCTLFFKGQPNSGKSVMSSFISRLFDKELVSNIPLHQLGDRFFRAELSVMSQHS